MWVWTADLPVLESLGAIDKTRNFPKSDEIRAEVATFHRMAAEPAGIQPPFKEGNKEQGSLGPADQKCELESGQGKESLPQVSQIRQSHQMEGPAETVSRNCPETNLDLAHFEYWNICS